MSLLLRHGTIHSATDPFATAVLIDDGVIAWIGQESTADALLDPAMTSVDLRGSLLTPAFADAWAPADPGLDPSSLGITAAHVLGDEGPAWTGLHTTRIQPAREATSADILACGPGATSEQIAQVSSELGRDHPVGAVVIADRTDVGQLLTAAKATDPMAGLRVQLPAQLSLDRNDIAALAAARLPVVVGSASEGGVALPLADLISSGIPVALGTGPGELLSNPWSTLTAAVASGPAPLTTRAAFNAHTRGVGRLGLPQTTPHGTITVGAPASVAAWEVDTLTVQAPDSRIASWSTDPRAGTPLLPALGAGERLPECLFTLLDGQVSFWADRLPRPEF